MPTSTDVTKPIDKLVKLVLNPNPHNQLRAIIAKWLSNSSYFSRRGPYCAPLANLGGYLCKEHSDLWRNPALALPKLKPFLLSPDSFGMFIVEAEDGCEIVRLDLAALQALVAALPPLMPLTRPSELLSPSPPTVGHSARTSGTRPEPMIPSSALDAGGGATPDDNDDVTTIKCLVQAVFPETDGHEQCSFHDSEAELYRGIALWLASSPFPNLGPYSALLSVVGIYLRDHHAALWNHPERRWPKVKALLNRPGSKGVFRVEVPEGSGGHRGAEVVKLALAALLDATQEKEEVPRDIGETTTRGRASTGVSGAAAEGSGSGATASAGQGSARAGGSGGAEATPQLGHVSTPAQSTAPAATATAPAGRSDAADATAATAASAKVAGAPPSHCGSAGGIGAGGGSGTAVMAAATSACEPPHADPLVVVAAAAVWPGSDPLSVIKRRSAVLLAAAGELGAEGRPCALLMARLSELLLQQEGPALEALKTRSPGRRLCQALNEGPAEGNSEATGVGGGGQKAGPEGGAANWVCLRTFKGRHDMVAQLDRAALLAAARVIWSPPTPTRQQQQERQQQQDRLASIREECDDVSMDVVNANGRIGVRRSGEEKEPLLERAGPTRGAAGATRAAGFAAPAVVGGVGGSEDAVPNGAAGSRGASGSGVSNSAAPGRHESSSTPSSTPASVPSEALAEDVAAMAEAVWPGEDVVSVARRAAAAHLATAKHGPLGPCTMSWARLSGLLYREVSRLGLLPGERSPHAKSVLRHAVDGATSAEFPKPPASPSASTAGTARAGASGTGAAGSDAVDTAPGATASETPNDDAILTVVLHATEVAKLNLAALARAAATTAAALAERPLVAASSQAAPFRRPAYGATRTAAAAAALAGKTANNDVLRLAVSDTTGTAGSANGIAVPTNPAGATQGPAKKLEQALWRRFPLQANVAGAVDHATMCAAKRCVARFLAQAPPPHVLSFADLGVKVTRELRLQPLGSRLRAACLDDPDVFSVALVNKSNYVVRLVDRELQRLAAAAAQEQDAGTAPLTSRTPTMPSTPISPTTPTGLQTTPSSTPAFSAGSDGQAGRPGTSGQQDSAGPRLCSPGAAQRLPPTPGRADAGSMQLGGASSVPRGPQPQLQPQLASKSQMERRLQPNLQQAGSSGSPAGGLPVTVPVPVPAPVEAAPAAAQQEVVLPLTSNDSAKAGTGALSPSPSLLPVTPLSCFQPPVVAVAPMTPVVAAAADGPQQVAAIAEGTATELAAAAPGAPVHLIVDPYSPELANMLRHCNACSQVGLAVHSHGGTPVLVAVYAPDALSTAEHGMGPGGDQGAWPAAVYLLNRTACEEMYGGNAAGKEVAGDLMASLRQLLEASGVVKVVHGCEQVRSLEAACGGATTCPLLDTRVVLVALTSMMGLPYEPATSPPLAAPVSPLGGDSRLQGGAQTPSDGVGCGGDAMSSCDTRLQRHISTLHDALAASGLWADRPGLLATLMWRQFEVLRRQEVYGSSGRGYGNGGGGGGGSSGIAPTEEQMAAAAGMAAFLPELWKAMVDEGVPWIAVHAPLSIMARVREAAKAAQLLSAASLAGF